MISCRISDKEFIASEISWTTGLNSSEIKSSTINPLFRCAAGAVYQQARSKYISLDGGADIATARKEHEKKLRRSGFVLGSSGIPDAWEIGEEKLYSPLKYNKNGEPTGDSLLSFEEFNLLFRHTKIRLNEMAESIRAGVITADPCRMGSEEPYCRFCNLKGFCGFEDGENGESCRVMTERKKDAVMEDMGKESLDNV